MFAMSPTRPIDHAESQLIAAIIEGKFASGSMLPAERELAAQLGVTRPTLREALRRLERDGWITIHQGKPTRVNDFWWEGGLNVLSGIVRHSRRLPPEFVPNLLRVRADLAPSYTRLAVEHAPQTVITLLNARDVLDSVPQHWAHFDWTLQRTLAIASGNPVYALILNSFSEFYEKLAQIYFSIEPARASSAHYYEQLYQAALADDPAAAADCTRRVMRESVELWLQAASSAED